MVSPRNDLESRRTAKFQLPSAQSNKVSIQESFLLEPVHDLV